MNIFDGPNFLLYLTAIAGLLHACLQLPLAAQLHLAGHTLGKNKPRRALLASIAAACGSLVGIGSILFVAAFLYGLFANYEVRLATAGITLVCAGAFVMLSYFRAGQGAQLWLGRTYTRRFTNRLERSNSWLSAFLLGISAVWLESIISLPMALTAIVLLASIDTTTSMLAGLALYMALAALPLFIASVCLGSGASPASLMRWRVESKWFWQFFIGLAFILFGLYVASSELLRTSL